MGHVSNLRGSGRIGVLAALFLTATLAVSGCGQESIDNKSAEPPAPTASAPDGAPGGSQPPEEPSAGSSAPGRGDTDSAEAPPPSGGYPVIVPGDEPKSAEQPGDPVGGSGPMAEAPGGPLPPFDPGDDRGMEPESEAPSRGLGGGGSAQPPPPPKTSSSPRPPSPPVAGTPPPDDDRAGSGAPSPQPSSTDWDVVPVFYGTDRARGPDLALVSYTGERGRRMELGQALVTVPRSHKVPQIERPWSLRIPYLDIEIGETEDPAEHFTMQDLKTLTREEFLALARERIAAASRFKKHALVFIHGFNTTFDYAIFRTAQISYDLKFDGAAFSYSWPSSNSMTPTGYNYDRESSGQAVKFLRAYLEMVVDETGAESVSVIAHSMGNQPAMQVLKDLRAARPDKLVFNQIILAAPDVDRDAFENIASEIRGLAKNITLYAAANDTALQASRRFNGGIARAGDVPTTGPLIIGGVDTLDVSTISTDGLGLNHSGYAENNDLLMDIGKLVSTGAAPLLRMPTLEVVPLGDGQYWRFPKAAVEAPLPR